MALGYSYSYQLWFLLQFQQNAVIIVMADLGRLRICSPHSYNLPHPLFNFVIPLQKSIECALILDCDCCETMNNLAISSGVLSQIKQSILSDGLHPPHLLLQLYYTFHQKIHHKCSKHQILIVQKPNSLAMYIASFRGAVSLTTSFRDSITVLSPLSQDLALNYFLGFQNACSNTCCVINGIGD